MPIYEYQREDGSIFEAIQSITEDALEVCPTTGQKVNRLISKNTFKLVGDGWYVNTYGTRAGEKGKENDTAKSDSGDTKKDSSSAEKKDTSTTSTSPDSCGSSSIAPRERHP